MYTNKDIKFLKNELIVQKRVNEKITHNFELILTLLTQMTDRLDKLERKLNEYQ